MPPPPETDSGRGRVLKLAALFILLAILPVLVVYLILSRFIIKGVTAGAVKG